jgi:hypothetical protein
MKRAVFVTLAAILALVLVYPATASFAKSPESQDTPTIQIITPQSGDSDLNWSDDDGDADDLAGVKGGKKEPSGASSMNDFIVRARFADVWRMYILTFRLY